jgi:hypothetical protein
MSRKKTVTVIVSSLSALIAALACNDSDSVEIIYVPIGRNKGEASKYRNLDMQEKIVTDIGNVLGYRTCIAPSMELAHQYTLNAEEKIIDVNTIGYLEIHGKELGNVTHFVGAGAEHLSAFIPRLIDLNIKDYILKTTIVRTYLSNFGIKRIYCFVKREKRAFFFWSAFPINRNKYNSICKIIFQNLILDPSYEFLFQLSVVLKNNPEMKLLVVLPTAEHYGGHDSDASKCVFAIEKRYPGTDFVTVVKNHPSDARALFLEEREYLWQWNSNLERTFPIEIVLSFFEDRVILIGAGSSAMFALESGEKFMSYPGTKFGAVLAKRNSQHLLKAYEIVQL